MTNNRFEQIKHVNRYKSEYWSARELMPLLGYKEWRKFEGVIEKAKETCKNSGNPVKDHFGGADKMIKIATGTVKETKREVNDYHLSRYACYLVAQNGDPRKEEIALAQTYFAIQTRKQEVAEQLLEDQKRVLLREEMKTRNKKLAKTADKAGVANGYMGLYGGLRQKEIHSKKKLKKSQKILDHMGSEELAANLFRATQTEAKLKRERIHGQVKANRAHLQVGKKVRKTIKELGGTMPENLPTTDSVKRAKKRIKKGKQDLLSRESNSKKYCQ